MGLTAKTADVHYENRQQLKEREVTEDVSHRIGKTGSITSKSRSRSVSRSSAVPAGRKSSGKSSRSNREAKSSNNHGHRSSDSSGSGCNNKQVRRSRSSSKTKSKGVSSKSKCYDQPRRMKRGPCVKPPPWQGGKHVRDECGSGIVPKRLEFMPSRKVWCKTPLSMYQATIGELGRKILCREKIVPRDVKPGPPCNVCEDILPLCRGYYRKYDCLRPCEEEYTRYKSGKKVYRPRVERYWEPCLTKDQKLQLDINGFAGQNVFLGSKMRRTHNPNSTPCW